MEIFTLIVVTVVLIWYLWTMRNVERFQRWRTETHAWLDVIEIKQFIADIGRSREVPQWLPR